MIFAGGSHAPPDPIFRFHLAACSLERMRRFEHIRRMLEKKDVTGFQLVGQTYRLAR